MVITTARLTSKYQITLPAEIRRNLHLQAGDVVYLTLDGDQVTLRALRGGWTEASRGLGSALWQKAGGATAIEQERDAWDGSD